MGSQGEATGETLAPPSGDHIAKDQPNIYEDRPGTKKIIRIITVIAYLISVSFVAIVLSAYYVFLWQPPPPRLVARPRIMDKAHTEYLVQSSPRELDSEATSNLPDIFHKINLFKNEILRHRGSNNSEKGIGINETRKNAITSQKPIEPTQMPSDKVNLGTWTGVYDFINSHTASGDREKSFAASTMFITRKNTSETLVTTDVEFSTTSNDFKEGKSSGVMADLKNKMLLGRRISADDSHHPTTRSTVDSTLGQSMEPSMVRELQQDRATPTESLLNNTEFMTDQLRFINSDSSVDNLNKNNTLKNPEIILPFLNLIKTKKREIFKLKNQKNSPKR